MADDEVTPLGTLTTSYGWIKPTVGADDDVWGGQLNADLDGIDATVKSVSNVANAAYPASNPSGYQTAAQVTAAVPVASSTTPLMNGTAAVGTGTTWARADHVHPSDTSRLPLAGGSLTGTLTIAAGSFLVIGHSGGQGVINGVAGFSYDIANGAIIEATSQCLTANRTGANGVIVQFMQTQTACGSISVANATSTAYNTSSDVRLKTDAQSFDAGSILDATQVYNFEWTSAPGVRAYGVMAQEANEVFPDAVHHDEENDTWGVDYSKYVPLLLNEIKALRERVASLEARAPTVPEA